MYYVLFIVYDNVIYVCKRNVREIFISKNPLLCNAMDSILIDCVLIDETTCFKQEHNKLAPSLATIDFFSVSFS